MSTQANSHFIKRIECPVCLSNDVKTLYSESYESNYIKKYLDDFYKPQGGVEHDYLKKTDYSLKTCMNCSLVFQENIPNDDLMFRLYEQWIDADIVCKIQEELPLWYHESYANQIVDLISFFKKEPAELKFLDFGMGWGKWCLMAKAFGCNVFGLELSKARIAYAQKNGIQVLEQEDLLKHTFDYINTDQVFEHIPNPLNTLKELLKSLKPGGVIKISVPNGNNIEKVLEIMDWDAKKGQINSLNTVAPLEHINCFKTKTIMHMARECQLERIDMPKAKTYYKSKVDFVKKNLKEITQKKQESTSLYFKKEAREKDR